MGIVSVEPMWNRSSSQDQLWKRSYTLQWKVETDDPETGAKAVRTSVPAAIGQVYQTSTEADFGSFCQSVSASCDVEGGMQWIVTAEYGAYDAGEFPRDPTQWTPRISWGFAQFQRIADKDAEGNDIRNSATEPFDPPLQVDDSRPILQVVWNRPNFDESWAETYRDTVNDGAFFGKDAKTVKCSNISANRVYNQDIGWFWEVTFEFQVNKDTWTRKLFDQGLYENDPDDDTKLRKIEINGVPTDVPLPLDGSGKLLPKDQDPVPLEFEVYKAMPFSDFGLDSFFEQLQNYTPRPMSD